MKSSWFSVFKRKDRHRGEVTAQKGMNTGCIQVCPVCEKPLTKWEREHADSGDFFLNHPLMKQFENKPDRIYIFGHVKLGLYGTWEGNQDLSKLNVCTLCYLAALEIGMRGWRDQAIRSRVIEAYDAELDSEIFTDAWGISREDFESVARARGDVNHA